MEERPYDPRIERLISLLYGELPDAEEREVRKQLAEDPALRAEWEELQATRSVLRDWQPAESAPSFVFLKDAEAAPSAARVRAQLTGWRARLRGLTTVFPWAVAATAVIVAALSLGGLRVERMDGAIAFRFGSPPATAPSLAEKGDQSPAGGLPLDGSSTLQAGTVPEGPAAQVVLLPAGGPFLTRQDFEAYARGMNQGLVGLLNEYGRQRDQEVANFLQVAFGGFSAKQSEDYVDLRERIDALGLGFAQEQFNTKAQLEYLLHQHQGSLSAPARPSPADQTEGEEK